MPGFFEDTPPDQTRNTSAWQHFQGWNHLAGRLEHGISHKGVVAGYDPLGDITLTDCTTPGVLDEPWVRFTHPNRSSTAGFLWRAMAQVHASLQHENIALARGTTALTRPIPMQESRPWLLTRTGNGNTFAIRTSGRSVHIGFIPTFENPDRCDTLATRVIIPAETPYTATYPLWLNLYDAMEKTIRQFRETDASNGTFRRPSFLSEPGMLRP